MKSSHDPNITSWALNELSPAERAAFEEELKKNPDLFTEAQTTQNFCRFVQNHLRDETAALTDAQRAKLKTAASGNSQQARETQAQAGNVIKPQPRPWWQRPSYVLPLSAAAAVVLGFLPYLSRKIPTTQSNEGAIPLIVATATPKPVPMRSVLSPAPISEPAATTVPQHLAALHSVKLVADVESKLKSARRELLELDVAQLQGSVSGAASIVKSGAGALEAGEKPAATLGHLVAYTKQAPVFLLASEMTGSGGVTKTGGATLTLAGVNTYTGGTVVNGGVLNVGFSATAGGYMGEPTSIRGTVINSLSFKNLDSTAHGSLSELSHLSDVQKNDSITLGGGAVTLSGGVTRAVGSNEPFSAGSKTSFGGTIGGLGNLVTSNSTAVPSAPHPDGNSLASSGLGKKWNDLNEPHPLEPAKSLRSLGEVTSSTALPNAPAAIMPLPAASPAPTLAAAPARNAASSLGRGLGMAGPAAPAPAASGLGVSQPGATRVYNVAGKDGIEDLDREKLAALPTIRFTVEKEVALVRKTEAASSEAYTPIVENPLTEVAAQPLSTFSIDVDTAAYANVRRFLNSGHRPEADAVRLEEMINYFPYDYEFPQRGEAPFTVAAAVAEAPWNPTHRLARIAIKGRDVGMERRQSNFVFLVDVSGSMDEPNKLPLVQQSLGLLTDQLTEDDRVAIVTYAGSSGLVLPSTTGDKKLDIRRAIGEMKAGGSTHGSAGIRQAYEEAQRSFIKEGVNRVILCTDGDFNVGIASTQELEKFIKEKATSGVFLSVLGYGTGNTKDTIMETLADKGNGNYAYIDSLSEARKVLVEQMRGTLVTVAKDVKIQVEFNPTIVRAYRLIGYENRMLAKEDFNNDLKDAGEIGAGHTVTALYEIVPVGAATPDGRPLVDGLKYQSVPAAAPSDAAKSGEMMTVKLRFKKPDGDKSELIEFPVKDDGKLLKDSEREFKFATAVAGFGLLLRNSSYKGDMTWEHVRQLAISSKGEDPSGYRGEFIQLIDKARGIMGDGQP